MELQSKPKSKEVRRRGWEALGAGSYWPFVGGNVVLHLIASFGTVLPLMICFATCLAVAAATGCLPNQSGAHPGQIPSALIVTVAVWSVVLSVPMTYAIGFGSWGSTAMALSAADRKFRFGLCVSGWGHGWKMAWTVMVQWTYLFLWSLLLIVPGIMKTFSYAMTKYVQVDHPDWGANRCLEESMRLMKGNRWRYFKLIFSFFWWFLLLIFVAPFGAAGLFAIFFAPYPMTAFACFYRQLLVEKGLPVSA